MVEDLRDHSSNWVLKRLRNPARLGRLEEEVAALSRAKSNHIPSVVDFSVGHPAYIVTPYLGNNLEEYLKRKRLPFVEAMAIFEQVTSAVQDAHRVGVIHRDIKPNNVVVDTNLRAYLIDFGLCQCIGSKLRLTTTDEPLGNSAFAAPECFRGRQEQPGKPCDIYSLGKLLYWLVSNRKYILRENLSPKVIKRINHKNPLARYYIERLLKGTVVENPAARWTITSLRSNFETAVALINRITEFENRDIMVLYDSFGLHDGFDSSSSRSATAPNRGNPPSNCDLGSAFRVWTSNNMELWSIELAIKWIAGFGHLEVCLRPDLKGKPDDHSFLEKLGVSQVPSNGPCIVRLFSKERPLLLAGRPYWVVVSVLDQDTEIAWMSAPLGFLNFDAIIAERQEHEAWKVMRTWPGFAHRILARAAGSRQDISKVGAEESTAPSG